MPYQEDSANRVRALVSREAGHSGRGMPAGLWLMPLGNMCAGTVGEDLMLPVCPSAHEQLLARPMDFSGRPKAGIIYVEPGDRRADRALAWWIGSSLADAQSFPPELAKHPSPPRSKAGRPLDPGRCER